MEKVLPPLMFNGKSASTTSEKKHKTCKMSERHVHVSERHVAFSGNMSERHVQRSGEQSA